jgi:hypothetical protein
MPRLAADFVSTVSEQWGERLDYSPASLRVLDALLEEWLDLAEAYGSDRPADVMPLAMPAAAYVGEVLRTALVARGISVAWVSGDLPGAMAGPHLLIGERLRVNLVKKAVEIFAGVDRPTFSAYADMVAQLARAE